MTINEEVKSYPLLTCFVYIQSHPLLTQCFISFTCCYLHLLLYSYLHHNFIDVCHGFSWLSLSCVSIEFLLELG